MRQLRLTRPARKANAERLTERQQALLDIVRWNAGLPRTLQRPLAVRDPIAAQLGYKDVRRACDRLVRRGLLMKVGPGDYRPRVLRERKA